jgi:hypothetical protein
MAYEHFKAKNMKNTKTMMKFTRLYKLRKYLNLDCLILRTSSTHEMNVTSKQQIKQMIITALFVVKIWMMNGIKNPAKYPSN